MSVADALKHTAGIVEKAKIRISTYSEGKKKELQIKKIVPAKGASGALGGLGGAMGNAVGAAAGALEQASGTLGGVVAAAAEAVQERVLESQKEYTVQFNPSQLTLSGYGGGMYQKTDYGTAGSAGRSTNGISYEPAKVRLMMNVTLIFDQVSVKDAFMADKIAMSPTSILTGAGTLAKELITGEEYSVQPIIEGFIGMLRQERTRYVTFCWGSMEYEGIVNSLNTNYTMFSLTGQPIRGEVELSMVLVDEEVGPHNLGKWKQHYEDAFGGNVSYRDKTQYVGNLLNL